MVCLLSRQVASWAINYVIKSLNLLILNDNKMFKGMFLVNLFYFLSFHFIVFYQGLVDWPSQANYCPIVFGRLGDTKTVNESIIGATAEPDCSPFAPSLVRHVVLLGPDLRGRAL